MDSSWLSSTEQAEVTKVMIAFLHGLFRQQKTWSIHDRRLVTEVCTVLRSEFPEVISSGQVSRSLRAALETWRGDAARPARLLTMQHQEPVSS
eukprot:6190264-Amphidinium_carterae.1